jgi:RNA polymerase sigma-70 factor (ECF subfamily)
VDRAVRGEPEATAALLSTVQPGVIKYCRARLGKTGGAYTTADDISQEVCIALLKALPRYRQQGVPFSAFVYGIAARKVTDAQRAAMKLAVPALDTTFERPDTNPGPEQQAINADQARLLSQLLNHLPETQREIVVLRVAVGLSADEVGNALNMTSVAVRVAQSRALARLRSMAAGVFDEPMERRAI